MDAGVLKKMVVGEGAVVTVKGARSVSLRHALDLPLPLNRTGGHSSASALLALADWLRLSSRPKPLLSLRIVGPTSIASSSPTNRLKLKRLAPGLVELSPPSNPPRVDGKETASLLSRTRSTTLWPIASLNGSEPNLVGFEKLLASVLGPKAEEEGSFRLLKADVSAQTFLKIGFSVETRLGDGAVDWASSWRTRPESARLHFEVLARVEGDKVVHERVVQVNPFAVEDTLAPELLTPNVSMSRVPIVYPPPDPFSL